jgi:hypothetical protein
VTPAIVFAYMLALDPHPPGQARAFASAISYVVEHTDAPAGYSAELYAATLVVYGYGEGRYCVGTCARGDRGASACSFQVRASGDYAKRLEASPLACTLAAARVMRASVKLCRDLRGYCGSCYAQDGAPAATIARDRARSAAGLVDAVTMANAAP